MEDQRRPDPVRPYLPASAAAEGDPPPAKGDQPGARREVDTVRPYLRTSGRVRPIDETLAMEAQVMATAVGRAQWSRLAFERRDIVALCAEPVSVAEIGARLGLHVGVTRVLVGDLAALGYLTVLRPAVGVNRDVEIIERVIRGLEAIR